MPRSSWCFAAPALALLLGGCSLYTRATSAPEQPVNPGYLADSPQRTALMDPIIEASVQAIKRREPRISPVEPMPPELLEEYVADQKAFLRDIPLPEEYWNQFQRNYRTLYGEVMGHQERVLGFYRYRFRAYLRESDIAVLEQWQNPVDPDVRAKVAETERLMAQYYRDVDKQVGRDMIENHAKRANELNQHFDVCTRLPVCVVP
ncbi:hypothetical protein [Pseudomonas graminis]